jgi:hypothetical protein
MTLPGVLAKMTELESVFNTMSVSDPVALQEKHSACASELEGIKQQQYATVSREAPLTLKCEEFTATISDDSISHKLFLPGSEYTCEFAGAWSELEDAWTRAIFTPVRSDDTPVPTFYSPAGSRQDVPFIIWHETKTADTISYAMLRTPSHTSDNLPLWTVLEGTHVTTVDSVPRLKDPSSDVFKGNIVLLRVEV